MRFTFLALIALCACVRCSANDSTSLFNRITNFPNKLFNKVNSKASLLEKQLDKQTEKYLQKLAKREEKLKKQLQAYDSNAAKNLFANNPEQQYALLAQKLKADSVTVGREITGEYMPNIDSLQGSLKFLNANPQLLNSSKVLPADIQNSLAQLQLLQAKMQDADQIKQYLRQRKEQIKQYLAQYTHLPPGITDAYNDYNKQLYYYSQQVREYKEILNDPDKMMKTALVLLNKLPAFATFMKNNSFLAGLFGVPADYGTAQGMMGLQTRDQVLAIIQSQIASGGPNATAAISQNLQSAQTQLNNFKDKLTSLGGGSGDIDMPNFKPNDQKTKTFWKRLQYGTNMQTTHGSYYFPTPTDLGVSLGYKINDHNTIGMGASYKIGWGTDISHIHITEQGAGLRSFIDVQVKKSFYASGGFEYNYQPPPVVADGYVSSWQQSGLIGVSKIVSMKTKIFKQTKLQLLWDFLSYQQVPKTQPFKFRIGYNF